MNAKALKKTKTNKKAFGKLLKEIRTSKYIDQVDLSIAAECSVQYISRLENGRANPTLDLLEKLSDALDVPMTELVKYRKDENN